MFVIAGTLTMDPEKVDAAMEAAVALMLGTRAEEGCIDYALSPDPSIPGGVRIFEKWTTEEAINGHMRAPHMADFQSQVGAAVDAEPEGLDRAHQIRTPQLRPVGGEEGLSPMALG